MKKTNRKGFTLIELMIVVAIIGILAAIAIPNFIRYQLRSKTTEAKVVMGGIKTSEESFRAEYDNYVDAASDGNIAGETTKVGWVGTGCSTACNRQTPVACSEFACMGYEPAGMVYYQYIVATVEADVGTAAEYSIGANADLDGDTTAGSFSYRTATLVGSSQSSLADGISTCGTIPAGEVYDCVPNVY